MTAESRRRQRHMLLFVVLVGVGLGAAMAGTQETGPVVTFAGAFNQDGCPDCCRFACRLTPTPTPEFDQQGRRVFQRPSGRFLLIVEGAPGLSLREPSTAGTRSGRTLQPLGGLARPGLQVLFDNALGNGSLTVDCGGAMDGGIPSWIGLDENQISAAMLDASCRFEWLPDTDPCTRDRVGGFSTLSRDTSKQYCFQVPPAAVFPVGETVVQIQLTDQFGDPGPVEEIVIRVGSAGPTPTPTVTPVGAYEVSGLLAHYQGTDPIGGATVEASSGAITFSDGSGHYATPLLPATMIEIVPRKDGDLGDAVSALDAAYVLQKTAGMRTFSIPQALACDVTGDGTVSNLDASEILKLQVGLIDRLAVTSNELCGADWIFYPFPASAPNQSTVLPEVGGGECRAGAIGYDPLSDDAGDQSFFGIPFGDCTGNWQSGGGAATSGNLAGRVRLGRVRRSRSGVIRVPLYIDGDAPFRSAEVAVAYDPDVMVAQRLRRTRTRAGGLLVANHTTPGRFRLAIASARPIDSAGRPVAVLRFRTARGVRRGSLGLTIVSASVDEGR